MSRVLVTGATGYVGGRSNPWATLSLITPRPRSKPRGLLGRAYWYAVAPFHSLVFPRLLQGIVTDAEGV